MDQVMEEGEQFSTNEYNPAVEMMIREDNERLYEAMRTLTDKQYQALWRYAVDGLTFQEIGVEMGIRWETVREHYKSALKKLRKILRDTP